MNKKVILGVSIMVLLLGVVGFAALSTELKINGTGTVKSATWEVKFANLQEADLVGDAKEIKAPELTTKDTHIETYKVELTSPGDSASYTFDVVNNGTFDAEITSITVPTPECQFVETAVDPSAGEPAGSGQEPAGAGEPAGSGEEPAAPALTAADVCANLEYTLTYSNGTAVSVGDELKKLSSGQNSKTMKLTLKYKDTVTDSQIPDKDVEISKLGVTVVYGQKKTTTTQSAG